MSFTACQSSMDPSVDADVVEDEQENEDNELFIDSNDNEA
jgi:hypothetical protein